MIMRWCNVQTNEHDLQAKTYLNICIHHKLHNNNENKIPVFTECICNKCRLWCNKHLGHTTTENMIMGNISGTWNHYFSLRIAVDWLTYALVDWATIGSDNGLSSPRHPSSIGSRTGILLTRHPEKTFQINLDHNITFNDTSLKCRRHFVPGVSVFTDELNFSFLNLTLHSCIFIFNSFQFPIL